MIREEKKKFSGLLESNVSAQIRKIEQLEGWLHREQGEWLAFLAATVPAGVAIVELGSWKGKSTAWLSLGSKLGNKAPVFCVDTWCGNEKEQIPWAYPAFQANLERLGLWQGVNPIHGATRAVGKNWRAPIGLLFIDAAHDFDDTLADYYGWYPFILPGGWLVMHDTDILAGPSRVVEEVLKPSGLWTDYIHILQAFIARRKADRD